MVLIDVLWTWRHFALERGRFTRAVSFDAQEGCFVAVDESLGAVSLCSGTIKPISRPFELLVALPHELAGRATHRFVEVLFTFIECLLTLVGSPLAFVRDALTLVCDPVALVGHTVALVRPTLSFLKLGGARDPRPFSSRRHRGLAVLA
jgi:hypothetical protein